jgi:DnaJ family protein A protein 2
MSLFIVSGEFKGIEGEGMPHYRNPFEKGNLYIKFDVTFPENHFTNEIKLKVCFCTLYMYEVLFGAV